jgi:hypothetical protein
LAACVGGVALIACLLVCRADDLRLGCGLLRLGNGHDDDRICEAARTLVPFSLRAGFIKTERDREKQGECEYNGASKLMAHHETSGAFSFR